MATSEDKIEKIEKISRGTKIIAPIPPQEELTRLAPNKEHFDKLLADQSLEAQKPKVSSDTRQNSLMDEVGAVSGKRVPEKVTPAELLSKTEQTVKKFQEVKAKLETPGLEITDASKPMLRNKLTHVDEGVRVVLSKAGLEYQEPAPGIAAKENPVLRFLGLLTHGQYQLQTLATQVEQWHLNKTDLNPATMLAMQIKVGYIQQELEFFSSLLNKSLESTKTIMNVQV